MSIPDGLRKTAERTALGALRQARGRLHPVGLARHVRDKYDPDHYYDWAEWYRLAVATTQAYRTAQELRERFGEGWHSEPRGTAT